MSDGGGRGGGGRRLLRVGANATDDASTSRLVKQLFGASIRRRVSRRSLFGVLQGERSRAVSSFDEKCERKCQVYTGNAVYTIYISRIGN